MKIAIIDGDSIGYISSKDTLIKSINNAHSLMHTILERTDADGYMLFLSVGPYFRHQVNSEYKGNRKGTSLKYIKTISAMLKEEYGGIYYKGIEADDMVAYAARELGMSKLGEKVYDVVVCSPDKDVIKQVPGTHFNYRNHRFSYTKPYDAIEFLWIQTLMGDSTDNIKGLPGIGPVKAKKLLIENTDNVSLSKKVEVIQYNAFKAYLNHYGRVHQALFELQKNFRQVYLLRTIIEFQNEVGYIPELPEIIFIEKEKEGF